MPHAALNELVALAGLPAADAQITGDDPVIPTQYRVGAAGAAALAATGLAAADLWTLRGGKPQPVSVNLRHATASLRSAKYLRINGKPIPPIWDAYSGFYPVKDGRWVSIHCNFINHREAAMQVLGNGADRKAADRKTAEAESLKWDGLALEDAIHAAGGCAGFVRTAEEWAAHPQSAAVAAQPLLEIVRIGDAPPEPLPKPARPLSGIRVLDLTRVLAGPTCARTLAEHGADVLKITAAHLPDSGLVELDTGIGKLSARLDLRTEADTLRTLVRSCDVFSQSYRPGTLARRGFSPEALAKLRPGIVCVTLSAWGTTGPWNDRRGFDSIVQCVSGMAHAQGTAAKPALLPVSAIDYVTGYLMALGAMVALARRAREGGSWLVRVGLARTGKWIVDRGIVSPAGVPEDFPETEIDSLCTEVDAPDGRIRYLKPVVAMPETQPYWARPPVPLGFHKAEWPA
ncbi:MAG: CoA transferase [Betaproteobacteria bacterium]|nr:CoA transferase [Betaproteobacteria bacterium]